MPSPPRPSPPGLATVAGAGSYANGDMATFAAPAVVTNGLTYYTFAQFNRNGSFLSGSSSLPWTFATTDDPVWGRDRCLCRA